MMTVFDNCILLLGGNAVLPITVNVDENDNISIHYGMPLLLFFAYILGDEAEYFNQFNFESSFTKLDDSHVAVSYRGIGNHLTIALVQIDYRENTYHASLVTKKEYSGADDFKGICCMPFFSMCIDSLLEEYISCCLWRE